MEHPDIGEQCSREGCKQLDFLPFVCSHCQRVFCKEHFHVLGHGCPAAEDAASDTCAAVQKFCCSHADCSVYSPVKMVCPECQLHFCLAHRHHSCFNISPEVLIQKKKEWDAPRQQFEQSIKNVTNSVNESIKKAQENPKKRMTANKIQLMRLKGKAKGQPNIPTADRVYFLASLPRENHNGIAKEVYVSKQWTLGRVIDSIADVCKVTNKNNQANSPKLRLFKLSDGQQLCQDMSVCLSDLLQDGGIIDGDSLVLEFVPLDQDLNLYSLNLS